MTRSGIDSTAHHRNQSGMTYDFETVPDRANTGSLKWNKYAGTEVIPLWVADMDFVAAPEILAALHERVDHGVIGYTHPTPDALAATIAYLERVHGVRAGAEHLFWMPGMVPALNLLCHAFAKPGEGIMTATPIYPPFTSAAPNQGRRCIAVPLAEAADGSGLETFDRDAMEDAVTPDTRVFILCNPHNPVGRVYTRDELTWLAEFCVRHDLVLISDEIHCDLVLDDDAPHISTTTLDPALAERTVTMLSPSKTYNLPGLCCAYSVIPNDSLRRRFARATKDIFTEINCFGYAGLTAAYTHGEPWRQELMTVLRGNRDRVYDVVGALCPEVKMRPMAATYLAWMDVSALGLDHPAAHFEAHGVGLSPGSAFSGPGHVRLNFGCPRSLLDQGLERFVAAVAAAS